MISQKMQMHAFAMSVSADGTEPVLLLKDKEGDFTLPVILNPLEAGITLTQSTTTQIPWTPHRVTEAILKQLGVSVSHCEFVKVENGRQMVNLSFAEGSGLLPLMMKASDAMSFVLHLNVPIFATPEIIRASRSLTSDRQMQLQMLGAEPQMALRSHPYLM